MCNLSDFISLNVAYLFMLCWIISSLDKKLSTNSSAFMYNAIDYSPGKISLSVEPDGQSLDRRSGCLLSFMSKQDTIMTLPFSRITSVGCTDLNLCVTCLTSMMELGHFKIKKIKNLWDNLEQQVKHHKL